VEGGIDADEAYFTATVFVGDSVERFEDCPGCGGDEAGCDGGEGHVDEEEVDEWLGRADHVFCWGDKLDDRVAEFGTLHAVEGLSCLRVIVKHLRG
jgi:hypothetical protein